MGIAEKNNDLESAKRRKKIAEDIARAEDIAKRKTTAMFALPGVFAEYRGESGKNYLHGPVILRAFEREDGWDYELLDICSDGFLSSVRDTSNFVGLRLTDCKEVVAEN